MLSQNFSDHDVTGLIRGGKGDLQGIGVVPDVLSSGKINTVPIAYIGTSPAFPAAVFPGDEPHEVLSRNPVLKEGMYGRSNYCVSGRSRGPVKRLPLCDPDVEQGIGC